MTNEELLQKIKQAAREGQVKLDLSGKNLTSLPPEIGQIQTLAWLDLSNNRLTSLPAEIGQLKYLTWLDLSKNQFKSLLLKIGYLENLTWLNLSNNKLASLPIGITRLKGLTWLYLNDNCLKNLPTKISQLQNLSELYLRNNHLNDLPVEIIQLQNLAELDLNGNQLDLPENILAQSQQPKIILDFYKQLQEQEEDYLCEAKLIVVGEGEVGKTSLIKKIHNPSYKLQKEKSTVGIDITQWKFLQNDRTFRVNIWDFSGQEIDHSTHQFFLTEQSFYILVVDSRRENTDFFYWLNVIKLMGKGSPLLIVKNEKDGRPCDIPERQLYDKFPNLEDILTIDLANQDFTLILDKIKRYISEATYVSKPLPKSWVKVRKTLEQYPQSYISIEEYSEICQQHGLVDNQLQLSKYLHNLGVCLHFQGVPHLEKIIILNHAWCTDAVYKVLNDDKVRRNFGKFTRVDLTTIWEGWEQATARDELLELMKNFDLCYEIPGSPGTYLAPQLLSLDPPNNYEWDNSKNLVLKYEYEFMLKGILTRLIVETQGHIDQIHWRSGVVLYYYQTTAEVVENYSHDKGEIKIRVVGKRRKELLTIIEHELDKIHKRLKDLKVVKKVPCNCLTCKDSPNPYLHESNRLKEMIDNQVKTVQCGKPPCFYCVDILSLINDVTDLNHWLEEENLTDSNSLSHVNIIGSIGSIEKLIYQNKDNQFMSNIYQNHSGSGDNVAGDKNTSNVYNSQDLTQAAKDITALLDQLSSDYPTDSPRVLGAKAIDHVEKDPQLKSRLLRGLKAGSFAALEKMIDHPVAKFFIEGAKEILEP